MSLSIRTLFALLIASCTLLAARAQEPAEPGFDHEHRLWSNVLTEFVSADRVDYLELSNRREDLDRYLLGITAVDPSEFEPWTKEQRLAFWINAYNAFTVHAALANYPLDGIDSLRDVGGKQSGKLWKEKNLRLGRLIPGHGEAAISLDEILELVLRPRFKDARVHAALSNGCLGSPALRARAFMPSDLNRQLSEAARAWLADPLRTRFSKAQRLVETSSAFDAYRDDFVRESGSVEAWIARYAPQDERAWLAAPEGFRRTSLAFDWKLNDVEREAK
jgi:hypothetical protein